MKKLSAILTVLTLGLFAAAAPVKAAPGSAMLEEQYKAALSRLTQDVHQADDPAAKREILNRFIDGMRDGLRKAENLESVQDADRQSLKSMAGRFYAYKAELEGLDGFTRVADGDLNAFAGYVQQGMEQAPMSGGIYLSGTVLIVMLLLLIFLL